MNTGLIWISNKAILQSHRSTTELSYTGKKKLFPPEPDMFYNILVFTYLFVGHLMLLMCNYPLELFNDICTKMVNLSRGML